MDGLMRFLPVGEQYHFTGKTATGKVIAGLLNTEFNPCGVPDGCRAGVDSTRARRSAGGVGQRKSRVDIE
jgi:hypothetical protein